MDAQNGADYAALAAKLEELSQVCGRLSRENADLRARVAQLTPQTGRPGRLAGRRASQAGGTGEQRVRPPRGRGRG